MRFLPLLNWSGISLLFIGGLAAVVAANSFQCFCPAVITPSLRHALAFAQNGGAIEIGVGIAALGLAMAIAGGRGLKDRTILLGFVTFLTLTEWFAYEGSPGSGWWAIISAGAIVLSVFLAASVIRVAWHGRVNPTQAKS